MKVELNRDNFKIHPSESGDYFDDLLYQLNVSKDQWSRIESVEIEVDSFNLFDGDFVEIKV